MDNQFTRKTETELSRIDIEELKISVSDSQIKKGGLFSFSYVTYKVTLDPFGWNVRRKEADFIYLRKYLLWIYPNHVIPPLLLLGGSLAEDWIFKKEHYLSKFLEDCLRSPDLKGCYFMQEFLSLADDRLFGKVMKDREKDKNPEILKNFYSVSG